MDRSYYDILEVPKEAEESHIKKAYFSQIRRYPNEKYPEEFKQIRAAYEVLTNKQLRQEYDAMSTFGKEITELTQAAERHVENEEYSMAASLYKKILMIEPSLIGIRTSYISVLIKNHEEEKAIKQLEKLIESQPTAVIFHYYMGWAYEQTEKYDQAISFYTTASKLDKYDINIQLTLSNAYILKKDYSSARKVIEEALTSIPEKDFKRVMYLFQLLKVDVISQDIVYLEITVRRIEELLIYHPDETQYVAWKFGMDASELFEYEVYDWSSRLFEKAIKLDPTNVELKEMYLLAERNKNIIGEFEQMTKDEKIVPSLRYYTYINLFGKDFAEEEFQEKKNLAFFNIERSCKEAPQIFLKSIKRVKALYPSLFKLQEEFLSYLETASEVASRHNDLYEKLNKDSLVTNSIKRLIALYLLVLEEEERANYFEDIMDEMAAENPKDIILAIGHLKRNYLELYELNSDFLQQIIKTLSDSDAGNTNYNAKNSSLTANTNTCFVATAAYGSPLNAELNYLRYWRDEYLKYNKVGLLFIKIYYKVSPYLAKRIKNSPFQKNLYRGIITFILRKLNEKYDLKAKYISKNLSGVVEKNE